MRTSSRVLGGLAAFVTLTGACLAQETRRPTFSLEAVAIEGSRLPGPSDTVRVGPGERFLAKFFLRDFSPNGELLRGYQVELDPSGFETGEAGAVRPPNFEEFRTQRIENPGAAYIDDKDPQYVHIGRHIIPIVDTLNVGGYRWLTVLLNPEEGPVHPQDGSKSYLGTV